MSTNFLGGVIFILVFAGIILVHEFGHFIASRMMKVEVEEFAIGFPPRIFRFWRSAGKLTIGDQSVVIPRNFEVPFDPKTALDREARAMVEIIGSKLVLRSIALADLEDENSIRKKPEVKNAENANLTSLSGPLKEISLGTAFTFNLIPLGGFNRIKGEEDPDQKGGMAAVAPWKRIIILVSGALMNLLVALVFYIILFSNTGIPDSSRVEVVQVLPNTPAATANIQMGDIIVTLDGQKISNINSLIKIINDHPNQEVFLGTIRKGELENISITPQVPADGKGRIGVALGNPFRPVNSFFETIPLSLRSEWDFIDQLLKLPGQLIAGTLSPQDAQIGGPRTIWNLFQQAVARDTASRQETNSGTPQAPSYYTILLIISLTLSVGVFNLLPLPALDGGRVFMSLVEVVIRRPIPAKYQVMINGIGFLLLVVILGGFYIKDLFNPVTINLP